jgi:FdrA protein
VTDRIVVRRNTYHDSVTLMLASRDAESAPGVSFAAALAATPVNLQLLAERGFEFDAGVGPNDLIVAIRADRDDDADAAIRTVEERLSAQERDYRTADVPAPRSLRSAARADDDLNVAFVSVPGRFSAFEVAIALDQGLHVFCFSDGMAITDEAALKRRAVERGLLFMGADCGTAIIDGVGFGFANALQRGPVGIVGASGTGIQQVTCLLDTAGVGISHAVGVGGRDLSAAVGGTMALHALELLAKDDATEVIALISKPPDQEVARRVAERAAEVNRPVVLGILGATDMSAGGNVHVVASLEETAARCAELCGAEVDCFDAYEPKSRTPGEVRGFFCGGTLSHEASAVVRDSGRDALMIDYGDDEYTQGRPHPMIDPTLRNDRFAADATDPAVGAIILDVLLGYGAHADPAAELAPLIQEAVAARNGSLSVVVSLCGTDDDPQDLGVQRDRLSGAGAQVTRNAAHAARLAVAATT